MSITKIGELSVGLLETDDKIAKQILNAIAEDINKAIPPIIDKVKSDLHIETVAFFQNTKTYHSLLYGELAGHFGLPQQNRKRHVDTILNTIAENIEITFTPVKIRAGDFTTVLTIGVLLSSFVDIFALAEGVMFSENGDIIDWLRWLLEMGDKVIIQQHEILFVPGEGRSEMAIMIPNDAMGWRVPPEYSGTLKKNWLTKALLNNKVAYGNIIQTIIEKHLKDI